jgi:glyoxylase-like metal-dependent hydrolase (beta-lactamase superfamily II)
MRVKKIGRSTVFTYELPDWNLNLHLIEGDRYNYIIDTGLGSGSVKPIMERIQGSCKPVVVINTHYHWDHVWGNWVFADSLIISHRLCREITERKWNEMIGKNGRYIDGEAKMLLPNVTFEGELYFEEDGIRLFYTPGHTIDGISVLDESDGVLNAGDNIGDTPEEIVPSLACDKEEYKKTLDIYNGMDFEYCVSGHNEVMGRDVIERILKAL